MKYNMMKDKVAKTRMNFKSSNFYIFLFILGFLSFSFFLFLCHKTHLTGKIHVTPYLWCYYNYARV